MRILAVAVFCLSAAALAHAAPPEPSGAHPRLLLDAELRAAWKATIDRGPVKGSIAVCQNARDTADHDKAVYMGAEWAKVLQACLVAWAATDSADHAKVAIRFFTALLDDLDRIGDKQGGDTAVQRDSGYSIRNLGPYTAIAYDWLHGMMSDELKARARARWKAWLAWYKDKGYRARAPGNNYQAGYLVAATTIAIAQGSEAGEDGMLLWRHVADELWGKDMAAALAPGGVLDGGDWPEGWQYGPLSVASHALAMRVAKRHGIAVQGDDRWLASLLQRHVHGLSPTDRVYAGGDTELEKPYLEPHVMTLNAVALGDTTAEARQWAKGELARLRLVDRDYLLYDALATVGDKPVLAPREQWPTWYVAANTGTLYARTRWDDKAVWFVAECQRTLDVDHRSPNTGNFVLSRGADDIVVDPTPYGSRSTLTSNAPTVASAQLPPDYIPSQGYWGEQSGWQWARQTKSGIVAARCDYADQYRFQKKASDVPAATRDFVLVPGNDGQDAVLLVIDRANTTNASRAMHLRFRLPQLVALDGDVASGNLGKSRVDIRALARSSGQAQLHKSEAKDCFKAPKKGQCDAARFPVTDYRVEVAGPTPFAVHAISASGAALPAPTKLAGEGWEGIRITAPREAIVTWPTKAGGAVTYRAPKGSAAVAHVILDGAETDGKATVAAKLDGDDCTVSVSGGGDLLARPAILALDGSCAVTPDLVGENAVASVITKKPSARAGGRATASAKRPSGCCGANTTPASPLATGLVVGALLLRRRRRSR